MTTRRLSGGTEVTVKKRYGIRKICACPESKHTKCPQPSHFSYMWKGKPYRFSLNRQLGKPNLSKSEAEREAEGIRIAIRSGIFGESPPVKIETLLSRDVMTLEQLTEHWKREKGYQRAQAKNNDYRLATICNFVLPNGKRLGDLSVRPTNRVTHEESNQFRDAPRRTGYRRSPRTMI
jgi:hypothetical protein